LEPRTSYEETIPAPVYPDVTIYCVRDNGKLIPICASVGGYALPILDGDLAFSPNATRHGTRALTATLTFPVGGGGIVEVPGPDAVPALEPFPVE
jgi:hypothetical protein